MSRCKNPECVNGRTPGVVQRSLGNTKAPLISNGVMARPKMYWSWVNCPACNPDDHMRKHGIEYKHVTRTKEEMASRAQAATDKVEYKPQTVTGRLAGIQASAKPNGHAPAPAQPDQSVQLTKLTETVTKLTEQISELLTENRALRKQLDAYATPSAIGIVSEKTQ